MAAKKLKADGCMLTAVPNVQLTNQRLQQKNGCTSAWDKKEKTQSE
jgi:hypothetical protein